MRSNYAFELSVIRGHAAQRAAAQCGRLVASIIRHCVAVSMALLSSFTFGANSKAMAQGPVQSGSEACAILVLAAATARPSPHRDEYFCESPDPVAKSARYFGFRLRSRYPAPAGKELTWVGSSLMGDFLIRKADGAVFCSDGDGDSLPLRRFSSHGKWSCEATYSRTPTRRTPPSAKL